MKIGILTYFDGINYGAFAQTYALQNRLFELGYENEIIAYKNRQHRMGELKSMFLTKNPRVIAHNSLKMIRFKKDQQQFKRTRYLDDTNDINRLNFDLIIIGSDEIWNFKNDLFGIDEAYFSVPFNRTPVISYAGCFGKVTLQDKIPDTLLNGLKRIKHISVRDDNSMEMIQNHLDKKATLVLDPTLLYSYEKELESIKIDVSSPYLLFYGINFEMHSDQTIEYIKSIASQKGLIIVSVGYYHSWADHNRPFIGPFEWMTYIKQASFVVTNMFHGTIFTIKFNRPFITIGSHRRKNKVESLLKHLNLEDRLIYFEQKHKNPTDMIEQPISYQTTNEIIHQEKENSEHFLRQSIDDICQ